MRPNELRKSIAKCLARPIIAWDGEGVNWKYDEGIAYQNYFMLSNSDGKTIVRGDGSNLEIDSIIRFIFDTDAKYRHNGIIPIHCWFGGNYDWNMILRCANLPEGKLQTLYDTGKVTIGDYEFHVMWSKILSITELFSGRRVTMYDIFSFFGTSFDIACSRFLGEKYKGREFIQDMKNQRNDFANLDIDEIKRYNVMECKLLVDLLTTFRQRCCDAGLPLPQWHGPGAMATYINKRYGVKSALDQRHSIEDEEFGVAMRSAYAGGRFELLRIGYDVKGPILEYDINSAYPDAMRQLPRLSGAQWHKELGDAGEKSFGLYDMEFRLHPELAEIIYHYPMPLFMRHRDSHISFPYQVRGWYWNPEYAAAKEFVAYLNKQWPEYPSSIIIHNSYWMEDSGERPFKFIEELYAERQKRKAAGDPSEYPLKLGINSLYGKAAQQIGGNDGPPAFHQLEYAGWITSYCRARIFSATFRSPQNVLAFATDAVFVDAELPLKVSKNLGDWEKIELERLSLFQSGIYSYKELGTDKWSSKTRGFPARGFDPEAIHESLDAQQYIMQMANKSTFITLKNAMSRGKLELWGNWESMSRDMVLMLLNIKNGTQKRTHSYAPNAYGSTFAVCEECFLRSGEYDIVMKRGVWHRTHVPDPFPCEESPQSEEYKVLWINFDEITDLIESLREEEYHEIV